MMMSSRNSSKVWSAPVLFLLILTLCGSLLAVPPAKDKAKSRQQALEQYQQAERAREALNGIPGAERTKRDYQRVADAYRKVYYTAPSSSKADMSVVSVAELMAESGRKFDDEKLLRAAIGQYQFLLREYPSSRYRFEALFTSGQIYEQDLGDNDKAREAFQDFLKRFPHHPLAVQSRAAIAELDKPGSHKRVSHAVESKPEPAVDRAEAKAADLESKPETPAAKPENKSEAKSDAKPEAQPAAAVSRPSGKLPYVTGIRHWSTPDYTRVAIDVEQEVKYEAGRVPNPDRIFFDLHDTKLASTLVGKTFDVSDGFLRRIRVAQYQPGLTRVVLEVDNLSDYSAFLLPNPYRLIIDIHGRKGHAGERREAKEKGVEIPVAVKAEKAEKAEKSEALAKPLPAKAGEQPSLSPKPAPLPEAPSVKPELAAKAPVAKPAAKPTPAERESAEIDAREQKSTSSPTSEPTAVVVAPREPEAKTSIANRKGKQAEAHQARPTADGERSLTRALGLKIGKIVVDAGHGGHDTGTIGPDGLLEKDLVLDVALRLGRELEKQGFEVVFTRDDDTFVPLETRTAIANKAQADMFISIHANSSQDSTARGVETYYLNFTTSTDALEVAARENSVSDKSIHELQDLVKKITLKDKIEESREFATDVQSSLYGALAAKDRNLKNRGVKKAPFIVLIGANMPSILSEISFVSNPTDERRLQTSEQRQKIADALYKGVMHYINGLSGAKIATNK